VRAQFLEKNGRQEKGVAYFETISMQNGVALLSPKNYL
jgi:hypothetical protein